MLIKEYSLKDYQPHCQNGKLTLYLWDEENVTPKGESRPLILICPGGSYEFLSVRESDPVMLKFLGEGYHVAKLSYTVVNQEQPDTYFPTPFIELGTALEVIHQVATDFAIDVQRIHCLGFSAGGHLVATYTGLAQLPFSKQLLPKEITWRLPASQLLAYPVIDFSLGWPREKDVLGQMKNVLPEFFTAAQKLVTDKTPPTFIWQTVTDQTVPISHALAYLNALVEHSVSFESHIYPMGKHGLALANCQSAKKEALSAYDLPHVASWFSLALEWLQFLDKKNKQEGAC